MVRLTLFLTLLTLAAIGCKPALLAEREERQSFEASDPTLRELEQAHSAGAPLPADEAYARLEKSCQGGNRQSCLFFAVNLLQRGGDRARAQQIVSATAQLASVQEKALFKHAASLHACLKNGKNAEQRWLECLHSWARFSTTPWAAVSGHDFSALLPEGDPPKGIDLEAYRNFEPGEGFYCSLTSGAVRGAGFKFNSCYRSVQGCEQGRAESMQNGMNAMPCEKSKDGISFISFNRRSKSYSVADSLDGCKFLRQVGAVDNSDCMPIGNVAPPQ